MPLTAERYKESMSAPPLCEQLRIRDLLDDVAVQVDGSIVAGFEVSGIQTYYASDEERNQIKDLLETLVRSLPERSMRMQVRFEISDGTGDLVSRYVRECRSESQVLGTLDRFRVDLWQSRESTGYYLRHLLHLYFIWDPRTHHQSPDLEWKRKMKSRRTFAVSAGKCIERSRQEHEELLAEFNSLLAGVEATLGATGMSVRRMTHQDIFLEIKRALHPLGNDSVPYRSPDALWYESARSQMANVNIEDEQDDCLKIAGLLYSWVSLKAPGSAQVDQAIQEPPAEDASGSEGFSWRLSHQR
jgi:hypothetical protein